MNLDSNYQPGGWLDIETDLKSPEQLTQEERKVLIDVAEKVVEWRMVTPAVLFLESIKPMNFVASQAYLFLEPYVTLLVNRREISDFRRALAKRDGIEALIGYIERLADDGEIDEKTEKIKEGESASEPDRP